MADSFELTTSDHLGTVLLVLGALCVAAVLLVTAALSRRVRRPRAVWAVAVAVVTVLLGTLWAAASPAVVDGVLCGLGTSAVTDLLGSGLSTTTEYPDDPDLGATCRDLARRTVVGAMAVGVVALGVWGVVVRRALRAPRTSAVQGAV